MSELAAKSALPLVEIAAVVFCVVAVEWLIMPFTRNAAVIALPVVGLVAIVAYSHIRRRESLREVGWRSLGFGGTAKWLLLPTLGFCMALVLTGWYAGSLRWAEIETWSFIEKLAKVLVGAVLQQHLLNAFLARRAEEVWGTGSTAVLVTASIFALLHLPNLWLTIFTFIAGALWVRTYLARPNLFALTLSHAVLSLVLSLSISPDVLQGMRVGYNYFRY